MSHYDIQSLIKNEIIIIWKLDEIEYRNRLIYNGNTYYNGIERYLSSASFKGFFQSE